MYYRFRIIIKKIIKTGRFHHYDCGHKDTPYDIVRVKFITDNKDLRGPQVIGIIGVDVGEIKEGMIKIMCNTCNTTSYITGDYIYCSKCDDIAKL